MSVRRNNAGLTLIEMLIALTIIASILSMVYGSYAATTRAMAACRTRMACLERGGFALRLMARQVRCAYAPSVAPGSSASERAQVTGEARARSAQTAAAPAPALFQGNARDPKGQILSFVTGGDGGPDPNARGLTRVTYHYDRAAMTLSMERHDGLDRRRPGPLLTVLRNVTSVELRFHDGRQWQETWDFRASQELPRAVKVSLELTDEAGRPHRMGTALPVVQQMGTESRSTRRVAAGQP
jgi:type II secretion system protein J